MKFSLMICTVQNPTQIMETHLERSESTADFGAAVPLCNFQVSAPALEDLQFFLQFLKAASVSGGQWTSIFTLSEAK